MRAIFTPTVFRNNTPSTPITNHPLRHILLLALLALTSVSIKAADYVFTYNNGYLAVDNNGNITYANTFNPQCIWTCVSSTTNLTAAALSNSDNYYLYTEVSGTKYWLVDATDNGTEVTTSNTANNASGWRNNNDLLYTYTANNGRTFYLYYRDGLWRTSRYNNPNYNNRNNNTYYNVRNNPMEFIK